MADEKKPTGWVSGRVRESADGLGRRRPQTEAEQQRMREAAEREAQKPTEEKRGR